ncbi:MAG: insulinase family protein [Clostridia bacterium]|nr:insulinase family protein [Clostridia bacterium]
MSKAVREEHRRTSGGVDVYAYRNEFLHGFHLSLFVRAGSMHEPEDECGISHFFEHVAIRNVNRVMNGALYSELDAHGVEFNASTYSEMIQFYTGGAEKNFRFAADILMKVLSPISLSAEEIATERARIKAEIRESDERTSLTAFTNERVHKGTSLARSITGTVGGVNKIGKCALENFRKNTLTRGNIFFYVTGCVSEEDMDYLLGLIDSADIGDGSVNENLAPVPQDFGKRAREVHVKNADFTMPRFTFDLDMSRISIAEADLVYDILLSGYSSEFFIELSEKRGLFYDVSGSLERYNNLGTLSFSFEVKSTALYESVEHTVGILRKMKTELLPDERCMRSAYVDNAYMLLDDARELNFTFAYDNHVMNAGYADISERVKAYAGVTPERIRELCREIFKSANLTFTMKGSARRTDRERILALLDGLDA